MSTLSKKDKFILLVNLFCIQNAQGNWPAFHDAGGGDSILSRAMDIPEDVLPDDVSKAYADYVNHATHLRFDDMLKPEWLPNDIFRYYYRRYRPKTEWKDLGIEE